MNREQIIQMARESELIMETNCTTPWVEDHDLTPYLEAFAKLVAEHERDACVQIVESEAMQYAEPVWAFEIVNDIKARGIA
jgi:hypothetical protein